MASGKTLSTGTMNLKFMQNALRAQQIKAADLPKAEVKDDGQWEVPQAVRDAWGLTGDSKSRYGTSFILRNPLYADQQYKEILMSMKNRTFHSYPKWMTPILAHLALARSSKVAGFLENMARR
jgi:hypothetical protein